MKTKFIILLIILTQFSCKEEKSELERSWILVEHRRKPNSGWMQQLRGLLVCFEGNKMKYSFITSKEETKKSFIIENQFIKIDTSTFGKIIHLSKDSLIIEADTNSYDMHFRPLEEVTFNSSEKQTIQNDLINSSWKMEDGGVSKKFYCDTAIWRGMPEDKNDVKCVVYEQQSKDWKEISDYEWWTLKHFDGKLIYGYSYGQTENSFFQITENRDDTLKVKYLNPFEENWIETKFEKGKILSIEESNKLKKMIIGEWEIEEIIEPNLKQLDSIEYNSNLTLESRTSNKPIGISKSALLKKAITFSFKNNGSFQIIANGKEVEKGNLWNLTNDGKYIKLEKGITGYSFIKINDLTENKMEILKMEMVDSEVKDGIKSFQTFLNFKLIKKEN